MCVSLSVCLYFVLVPYTALLTLLPAAKLICLLHSTVARAEREAETLRGEAASARDDLRAAMAESRAFEETLASEYDKEAAARMHLAVAAERERQYVADVEGLGADLDEAERVKADLAATVDDLRRALEASNAKLAASAVALGDRQVETEQRKAENDALRAQVCI